ncbi:phospholipase A2-like isoform X1 [Tribolium madens]|uniref:phospholipase A2-like isoform X1 n=2 Tax=Tribolium madens TaxID=41895 RepID=UPI001CF7665A|nr:phospholipase A2-like isoform X1 [Tribolium madens]
MLKNTFLFVFMYFIISAKYHTNGLKCELKGLVNNRVQCILHDRGINPFDTSENSTARLLKKMQKDREKPKAVIWKHTFGLDSNKTFFPGNDPNEFKKHIRATIPGTRWCGDGDREGALSYDDLMVFLRTENCCKTHEACVLVIEGKESKYKLINEGLLRRYHCECEKKFRECLKNARNNIANKIGFTYFTLFGPQCFREDFPKTNCTKTIMGRCADYAYEKEKDKKYQWFDIATYH